MTEELKKGLEELKAAIDEAVAKKLNQTEGKIKSESDRIAQLLEAQNKIEQKLATLERRALLFDQNGHTLKYDGKLSNEHVARGFGLLGLAIQREKNLGRVDTELEKKLADEFGVIRGQVENQDSAGGMLVQNEMKNDLIRLVAEYGVFRANTKVVPLSTGGQTFWPTRTGGVTVYNPGEAKTITASQMSFGNVSLTPRKWAALTAISTELSEDAVIAIGELIATEMAWAFAKKTDECGFLGDGTSTYFNVLGLIPAAGSAAVKQFTGNTFAEVTTNELCEIVGMIQDYADADAAWYMHRRAYYGGLVAAALSKGGVTAEEVRQNAFRGTKTYLAYPVRLTPVLPGTDSNSQKWGVFGSLRTGSILGDRRSFEIARSTDVYFTTDQIGLRATARLDIAVHDPGTASAVGSYVVLQAAAA